MGIGAIACAVPSRLWNTPIVTGFLAARVTDESGAPLDRYSASLVGFVTGNCREFVRFIGPAVGDRYV